MNPQIRLCLVLHNHQPIGNFEHIIAQAYEDSYLPFLDVFEEYAELSLTLHTSGPLMLWLEQNRPEYIQRVRRLVAEKRVEILGGPYYEPILPMLPSRDRIGQITAYRDYLTDLLDADIRGMWMPERVWESALTADIARAGVCYTVLDDYHFKAAGWPQDALTGCFITEEDGHLLRIFPGNESLRYLIPFATLEETFAYCREVATHHPGSTLVFGDDGEKFGSWPNTKRHVYEEGWLRRFFDSLVENQDWIQTKTLAAAVAEQPPVGKIYLPDCSYREMTEWAMPSAQQELYHELTEELAEHPRWTDISRFIRGGNWRNFRTRYAEADEMYARMMEVSRNVELTRRNSGATEALNDAQDHLYRGQCNCPYWHGSFGGIYLPHLRNAIYSELIAADNKLEQLERGDSQWVDARSDDFNFDMRPEVRLANERMIAYIAPAQGGMMYELDVRSARHNLLATIQRREEPYHRKLLNAALASDQVNSAVEEVACKQDDLDQRLQYDAFPRKSFLEHFYDNDACISSVADGKALERGDFVAQPFEAKLRRAASKVQLQLTRDGNAWGIPIRMTKAITLEAGSQLLQIAYLLEGLPQDRQLHLALEWNFAGLPAGADDRYFYDATGESLGHLGTQLDLHEAQHLGLIDQWLGVDILIGLSRPTSLWTYPIETVSQSEGGIELVHQSVCVMPHWLISGDEQGKWSVQMQVRIDRGTQPCVLAEQVVQSMVLSHQ